MIPTAGMYYDGYEKWHPTSETVMRIQYGKQSNGHNDEVHVRVTKLTVRAEEPWQNQDTQIRFMQETKTIKNKIQNQRPILRLKTKY